MLDNHLEAFDADTTLCAACQAYGSIREFLYRIINISNYFVMLNKVSGVKCFIKFITGYFIFK